MDANIISRKDAIIIGLNKYNGSACNKCRNTLRWTKTSNCVSCKQYKPTGKSRGQKCKEREEAIKNNQEFYFTGKKCKNNHISKRITKTAQCVECKNTVHKQERRKRERTYSITKYGITKLEYDQMFSDQNGVCKICSEPEKSLNGKGTGIKPLAIDHCHETGKVRALLCSRCNIGIGSLKHNPDLMRKAALYCEEFK